MFGLLRPADMGSSAAAPVKTYREPHGCCVSLAILRHWQGSDIPRLQSLIAADGGPSNALGRAATVQNVAYVCLPCSVPGPTRFRKPQIGGCVYMTEAIKHPFSTPPGPPAPSNDRTPRPPAHTCATRTLTPISSRVPRPWVANAAQTQACRYTSPPWHMFCLTRETIPLEAALSQLLSAD